MEEALGTDTQTIVRDVAGRALRAAGC